MKKKNLGLVFVLLLIVIMVGTYVKQEIEDNEAISEQSVGYEVDLEKKEGLQKGQTAPDFTLTTLAGEEVTLSELQGKKVVLNFWATWCPPCKAEMPHMQDYYEKYADKDNVEIVAVNLTYSNKPVEKVQQFVDSFELTFPILLEEKESVSKTYEILSIPSTFIIDTEGKIQHQILGPLNQSTLREYVIGID
ncbi:peroxiredoxin family protein [Solibacillus sp. FSL H8-0538]|uniref:peroxiredoxin family protein n=1 Tax=Solibacillus sp. FSL H8-0538 TaxID=2921400 RepID=UPI0030F678AA